MIHDDKAGKSGDHYIVYGKNTYIDTLDLETIETLHMVGIISLVRTVRHRAGRTYIYVSVNGALPKGK